ncbi:MAG: aspartate 4-decarboxylase, partial [Prevotellaceae bacterium]|nr:aspartate 4-decarboxylase [Prevotellaceae bacterium]
MDIEKLKTSRRREEQLEQLSPFELKDSLINLAAEHQIGCSRKIVNCSASMLNAGRGNPNWTATIPREAFFTLGQFGIEECKRAMQHTSGIAGIPQKAGIAARFETFLKNNSGAAGISLLKGLYEYGIKKHNFVPDDFAMELAEGIIGDQYPSPDRMLKHAEIIVHDYLLQEMCGSKPQRNGKYDLFAVEGGTAAMCYI